MAVIFKADSDFSKVLKDFERLQAKNVQLEQKLKDVTKEVKTQGGGFKAVFEGGVGQLKAMIGGYASLQGAIALVNSGLAEQKRISQEINRVQMSAADAQAEVVKNLGNVSTEHATKFLKDVEEISKKSGAPSVAPVYVAAAQTLSAVGDEQLTKSILEKTLPFFKSKPEELPTFAGAVGDLAKIAKASSPEEIERVVSLVLSSQKYSRGATLESFQNVAPAVAAVSAVDTGTDRIRSIKEGLAFSAAISSAIADPDLALTKTATAEVATALAELLPEKDVLDATGNVKRRGTGLKSMAERLSKVQSDPALQRRFFETGEGFQMASFRGPIAPVIKSLVSDPSSPIALAAKEAFAGISDNAQVARQVVTNLEKATPQLETAQLQRRAESKIESSQLASTTMGRAATARDIVGKGLDATNQGFFDFIDRSAAKLDLEYLMEKKGIDPLEAAEQTLSARRRSIISGKAGFELQLAEERSLPVDEGRINALRGTMTEQEREANDLLRALIEEVRKLRESNPGAGAVAAATVRQNSEGR